MSSGEYFSMSDKENKGEEKKQTRKEVENLKSQFMDRAKQFMDDTALGEGRKALQNFIKRVQGDEEPEEGAETPDGEYVAGESEEEWDDEEWDDEPKEELDWNRPEFIRAGYAKPGTVVETPKSLEDAQEESYSLRMNNLSGLLSRFGSEDASPETETSTTPKLEMDKPLFQQRMRSIHRLLQNKASIEISPELWLHPEVLTLLRNGNSPQRILLFVMAALFASTSENYLTQADQDWIQILVQRAGFMLDKAAIQAQVEQTFLFPERVHKLYQTLLEEPLYIAEKAFYQYRENLAKMFIFELASSYQADPQNIIRTLATLWQEAGQEILEAIEAVKPVQEQFLRFQKRKMASGSIFQKLRTAEDRVLSAYAKMRELSGNIEQLKQVTSLIEEEDALERLKQFHTHLILDEPDLLGEQALSLPGLRKLFVRAQLHNQEQKLAPSKRAPLSIELNPLEQKRAISRAKEGELKSLKLIHNYKNWRIVDLSTPKETKIFIPKEHSDEEPGPTTKTTTKTTTDESQT